MRKLLEKQKNCLKFIQILALCTHVNHAYANFVADMTLDNGPVEQSSGITAEDILAEDDAGVLRSVKDQLNRWQSDEDYNKRWSLEGTGLYKYPKSTDRVLYVRDHALKYFDKRLSGEIKKADEDSSLAGVRRVKQSIRPSSTVQMGEETRLKFKARILRAEADILFENPIMHNKLETNALKRDVNWKLYRDFSKFGLYTETNYNIIDSTMRTRLDKSITKTTKASIDYRYTDKIWEARIDQVITEQISARLSSDQATNNMAFGGSSNRTVQLFFNTPF